MQSIPENFVQVVELAAVLILTITVVSELIAVVLSRGHGLLNLGMQTAALAFALYLARAWIFNLVFASIFPSINQFADFMLTITIFAAGVGVDQLVKYFIWEGHFSRVHKIKPPGLLVGIVRTAFYLVAILSILQFVYGQTITALATLSGAFAVVLGLSAQTTLGEMFAGIAIAMSHPFHIGDWVKIGDLEEGEVVDQTWRTVRIRTRDKTIMNITNRVVAERPVKNFSHAPIGIRQSEMIQVSNQLDPHWIREILVKAMNDSGLVLHEPAPNVLFKKVSEGLADYAVAYSISNYAEKPIIADKIWKIIYATLQTNGVAFGLPERRYEILDQRTNLKMVSAAKDASA